MSPTCSTCSYNCICIVYLYLNLNQSVLKCNIPEEFRRIYQTRFQTGSHIVPIQRKNTMRKTADCSSITELHGPLFFKCFYIFSLFRNMPLVRETPRRNTRRRFLRWDQRSFGPSRGTKLRERKILYRQLFYFFVSGLSP